ncbi:trypsin-like serine peptidase [Luteimonas aquatica]|uniref:trypsin-like serine peptidase n=1 Tax=Luteimonas aquatica TaxID=450364 RepID=UPI001F5A9194|nr:trypsin-like serine protease [Luteimonas aquatica]
MNEKARFIQGENLVTDALPERGGSIDARLQTPRQRAAGLSTVMVTRDGDQYQSQMDPQDVAIFEQAVRDLELLGRTTTVQGKAPSDLPAFYGSTRANPTVVIGADNRVQITNTVASPYWFIGRIAIGCTGTLITAKHVLTAGHCVSNGSGTWYSSLDFTTAQNGSYQPWGTTGWTRALTTTAWHTGADSNYDYALIVLNAAPHGGNSGWGVYSGGTHTITGYPGDKPFGTMWTHSGAVSTSGSYRLCYTIDTAGGNSGSGIRDSGNAVRGIHTTGSSSQNCGTRITSTVYNTLQNWIAANP